MRIIQLAFELLLVNLNSRTRRLNLGALGTNTASLHKLIYPYKIFLAKETKFNARVTTC